MPALDYRHTLEAVARPLADEVHLECEKAHLTQAAAFYADSPDIQIPRPFPFSTPSVTATERVDGGKVTTADQSPQHLPLRGEGIVRALLGQPLDHARRQLPVGKAIGKVRTGSFRGVEWMTSLRDELAIASAVRFPEEGCSSARHC